MVRLKRMPELFHRFTTGCARFAGRPAMLLQCVLLALTGGVAYVTGNQLFIAGASMAISAVTLLLLPILQATQTRDDAALHAKLDELIKSSVNARNALIGLENQTQEEIQRVRADEQGTTSREV